ncbi:hypothetical protein DFS33DRAFT_648117 [Desarmillaria ectypa]|nr:hypothetical protein DFS33DRAFT_648117 [Desarmillaria ectypa]
MFISLKDNSSLNLFRWRTDFQFLCNVLCVVYFFFPSAKILSRSDLDSQVAFSTACSPSPPSFLLLMLVLAWTHGCFVFVRNPPSLLSRAPMELPEISEYSIFALVCSKTGSDGMVAFLTVVYHCSNENLLRTTSDPDQPKLH